MTEPMAGRLDAVPHQLTSNAARTFCSLSCSGIGDAGIAALSDGLARNSTLADLACVATQCDAAPRRI